MYATKIIYNGRTLCLPIIFSSAGTFDGTTVTFNGTTALFSNATIEDNTLIVSGVIVNNNTLVLEDF